MQSRYPHKGLNKNKEPPATPASLYFYFLIHMIKILASGTSTLLNQAAPVSFNGFKAFFIFYLAIYRANLSFILYKFSCQEPIVPG